jgi:hypothetical protein
MHPLHPIQTELSNRKFNWLPVKHIRPYMQV